MIVAFPAFLPVTFPLDDTVATFLSLEEKAMFLLLIPLKDFTLIDNVGVGALYHHERYDGTGYCHGLKGEEIPIEARIIGIADAFDAMTANRVYRKQLDLDFVIGELKRCSGTQFDPHLVEIMLSLIEEGVIDAERLYAKAKGEQKE